MYWAAMPTFKLPLTVMGKLKIGFTALMIPTLLQRFSSGSPLLDIWFVGWWLDCLGCQSTQNAENSKIFKNQTLNS